MSKFIKSAHMCAVLLGSMAVDFTQPNQPLKMDIETNRMFDRFVLRAKVDFNHGNNKAEGQKFGGIYNLINTAAIVINNDEPHYQRTGQTLYTDRFKRAGREDNEIDYVELPDSFTQEIDYCFAGTQTTLKGVRVPDGAFALDLRHDENLGNQTYQSVQLVIEVGTIHDVFQAVNNTSLSGLSFEVWGYELHHDANTRKVLSIETGRYGEVITKEDRRKVTDTELPSEFTLPALGNAGLAVNLSDIAIVQVDEVGLPIPFTNENEVIKLKVAGFDYCSYPIWQLRREQNGRRIEDVPPNMLLLPLVQAVSGFGGLSAAELLTGATLHVQSNQIEGQIGATHLNVEKTYSYKS